MELEGLVFDVFVKFEGEYFVIGGHDITVGWYVLLIWWICWRLTQDQAVSRHQGVIG